MTDTSSKYRFIYSKPHPVVEPCWHALVTLENIDVFHTGVTRSMFMKQCRDPHLKIEAEDEPGRTGPIMNPIILGAGWLTKVLMTVIEGQLVFVNYRGGWHIGDSKNIIHEFIGKYSDWPRKAEKEGAKPEKIIISRWPKGAHYYISSSKNRIFNVDKLNTRKEAKDFALMFADIENIEFKE